MTIQKELNRFTLLNPEQGLLFIKVLSTNPYNFLFSLKYVKNQSQNDTIHSFILSELELNLGECKICSSTQVCCGRVVAEVLDCLSSLELH